MNSRGVAIVIGGSQNVWRELEEAQELCRNNGVRPIYFVCNDMIEQFSKECVCVTLHADKLPMWLVGRTSNGFVPPRDIWTCTSQMKKSGAIFVTNFMDDLGGSSGLFCCRVAITHYGLKVILCGVPMTQEGRHFIRGRPWTDVSTFVHRWRPHINGLLKDQVRSYSGRTKEWFGVPDNNFVLTGSGLSLKEEARVTW